MSSRAVDVADAMMANGAEYEDEPIGDERLPEDVNGLDLYIERRMWAIRGLREQQARNTEQMMTITEPHRRRIAMAETWEKEQNASIQKRIDWIEQHVLQATVAYPFTGRAKSRAMPCGTFGKARTPDRVEIIDAKAAVAFCRANGIPVHELEPEPDKNAIKAYIKANGGDMPDGIELVSGYDKPYVKIG